MLHALARHYRHYKKLSFFYSHTLIKLLATSLFDIFSSIYIYQIISRSGMYSKYALPLTVAYFAYSAFCQMFALTLSLRFIHKGLNYLLFWGNIFLVLYYFVLELVNISSQFLLLAPILYGLYLGFYWIAFHIYFTVFSDDSKQGEEVAVNNILSIIASTLAPVLGGIVITTVGFSYLFIIMIILIFLSSLPFLFIGNMPKIEVDKNPYQIFDVTYFFKLNFIIPIFSYTVIEVVLAYIWPLFVFPILFHYETVGVMGSIGSLVGFFTVIIIGFLFDKINKKKIISLVAPADSIVWFFDAFVTTVPAVFVMTVYQAMTTTSQLVVCDSLMYEQARHKGVAKIIFEREICIAFSKFIFLIFAAFLFVIGMPIKFIFIITAAIASFTRFYPVVKQ